MTDISQTEAAAAPASIRPRRRGHRTRERRQYLVMLAPALLVYLVFDVGPKAGAIYISLFEWQGIGPMKWVGLQNYIDLFTRPLLRAEFLNAAWNNIQFFLIVMACYVLLGTAFALLLSFKVWGERIYRLVFFLPHPLATVAVAFLWGLMLNPQFGPVNDALRAIGLDSWAHPWLGDAATALPTLALINVWHLIGFPILLLLAGITGMRTDIVEAAFLDGATRWQVVRHIILPQLKPVYILLGLLVFIGSFNTFELVFVLQGVEAGPYGSTDLMATMFYRLAFGGIGATVTYFGLGSAVAIVTAILILPASIYFALRNLRRT